MTARTTTTSFFDITTNLWSDAFLVGKGGDFDNEDDGNNDRKDNDNGNARTMSTSFFDTTTNLWLDAFLEERGGDFNDNDGSNNAAY